jgi:hypothetical protein
VIFRKKPLPEPFPDTLITNLNKMTKVYSLKDPQVLKEFGMAALPMLTDPRFQLLSSYASIMVQLRPIYFFLTNYKENLETIEKDQIIGSMIQMFQIPDLLLDLLNDKTALSIIKILENSDLSNPQKFQDINEIKSLKMKKFISDLEKLYRKKHNLIQSYINKIRNEFNKS